jgi:hypothetical protein
MARILRRAGREEESARIGLRDRLANGPDQGFGGQSFDYVLSLNLLRGKWRARCIPPELLILANTRPEGSKSCRIEILPAFSGKTRKALQIN